MDFEIQFTDLTLLEANGSYKRVVDIMHDEMLQTGVMSHKKEWMLRSKITIMTPFGFSMFVCHFYENAKVFISEYMPSSKDIHTTDVRCLTYWCNHNGWQTPEPLAPVVESWLPFWKKEWETHIVDSDYLDKRFGSRQQVNFDNSDEDEFDSDDDI